MVPQTYPSILNPYTNRHEMVVKQLASTSGLQRWTDYIPVKLSASTRPAGEQTTDGDGFIAINTSQNTSTGVAFKDWVPVYFDNDATDAWVVSASGYIPIGASGGAIAILKSYGTDAHVYLPGANGVAVSGLPTNNYTLSNGSTGYSTVDGTAGLVLDAAGSVGAELVTTQFTSLIGYINQTRCTLAIVGDEVELTATATGVCFVDVPSVAVVVGSTYQVSAMARYSGIAGGVVYLGAAMATVPYSSSTTSATSVPLSLTPVADDTQLSLRLRLDATAIGQKAYFKLGSVKQVTGIHATQSTTANKPAVRRGLYNLLLNSATPATQSVTCAASPYTLALYGTGSVTLSGTGSGTLNGTGASDLVVLNFTPTAGSVTFTKSGTVSSFGLFQGTLTAAQILAEGGIPLTTSTAASNSNAGSYSWSFDGSNDYFNLSAPAIQMSDDAVVIAGLTPASSITDGYAVNPANGAATQMVGCLLVTSAGFAKAAWWDDTSLTAITDNVNRVNTSFVASTVKIGNAKRLRVNGTQSGATENTVKGTTTLTGGSIGSYSPTGSNKYVGNIGPVIVIKGTISDSDLLTLERWVASQTPNGPVF